MRRLSRCGRTARIGNKGAALLLISPSEETYIEFLAINQKVKLAPWFLIQGPFTFKLLFIATTLYHHSPEWGYSHLV